MYCPSCKQEYKCPCEACGNKEFKFVIKKGVDYTQCKCGFIETYDWWSNVAEQVYKIQGLIK